MGNQSLALTRDANLDTQSSDISAEEIRESGRSFQFLIVCGKKFLQCPILWDKVICGYSGFTLQTFVKQYKSAILPSLV